MQKLTLQQIEALFNIKIEGETKEDYTPVELFDLLMEHGLFSEEKKKNIIGNFNQWIVNEFEKQSGVPASIQTELGAAKNRKIDLIVEIEKLEPMLAAANKELHTINFSKKYDEKAADKMKKETAIKEMEEKITPLKALLQSTTEYIDKYNYPLYALGLKKLVEA